MPPTNTTPQPPTPPPTSYRQLNRRANQLARVTILLFAILVAGGAVGYYLAHFNKTNTATNSGSNAKITSLSQSQINALNGSGSSVGTADQLLTIAAASLFNGKVTVQGDASFNGKLIGNGATTLQSLSIGSGDLSVGGASTLQKGATVGTLLTVSGNLTVSGTTTANILNATTITVKNLSITGPLLVSHIQTQGPVPSISGGALGGGGTVSISGNDTAGTVNLNTGAGPGTGILASITFRAAYGAVPTVIISPLTGGAAAASVYVTRTATGFQLRADTAPPAGTPLSFSYLVVQ